MNIKTFKCSYKLKDAQYDYFLGTRDAAENVLTEFSTEYNPYSDNKLSKKDIEINLDKLEKNEIEYFSHFPIENSSSPNIIISFDSEMEEDYCARIEANLNVKHF